jgi:hypothetical protein
MRTLIIAIVIGIGCCAAQAQNAPKACDTGCSVAVPVVAVAPANTGTEISSYYYMSNPPTLTPYVSALSCQHHEEVVTVPSEDGGTRQIFVRRC